MTEGSGSSGDAAPPTFWSTGLGSAPFYTDWTVFGIVDLSNDAIVAGGAFEFRAIDSTCNIAQPLPDKKVDFVDISYWVEAFRGSAAAFPGPPLIDPCVP